MEQKLTGVEAASMEQESNNPSVVQEPTGLEVQPQKVVVDKELLDKIAKTLKGQMSEFINQMKELSKAKKTQDRLAEVPGSMIRAEDVGASPDSAERKKRGRKPNTKLLGELSVSFQLQGICIPKNIDLDKVRLLTQSREETSDGNYTPKFSVTQRLQNWNIQQKKRSIGMTKDVYYYHFPSQQTFRSRPEVVQFVLTETCPPKLGTSSKTKKVAKPAVSNHLVDVAVINQLDEAAVGNQDPNSTSNASTIKIEMPSSHLQDIKIDKMMSTEEMLNEFSIVASENEENCS